MTRHRLTLLLVVPASLLVLGAFNALRPGRLRLVRGFPVTWDEIQLDSKKWVSSVAPWARRRRYLHDDLQLGGPRVQVLFDQWHGGPSHAPVGSSSAFLPQGGAPSLSDAELMALGASGARRLGWQIEIGLQLRLYVTDTATIQMIDDRLAFLWASARRLQQLGCPVWTD